MEKNSAETESLPVNSGFEAQCTHLSLSVGCKRGRERAAGRAEREKTKRLAAAHTEISHSPSLSLLSQRKSRQGEEQTVPLSSLTVSDVFCVLVSLQLPLACAELAREHKVGGRLLCCVETIADLRDCGLAQSVLTNVHAKMLLQSVQDMKEKGVPSEFLRSGRDEAAPVDPTVATAVESPSELVPLLSSLAAEVSRLHAVIVSLRCKVDTLEAGSQEHFQRMTNDINATHSTLNEVRSFIFENEKKEIEEKRKRANQLRLIRHYCDEAMGRNYSPLFVAAEEGDEEGLEALLECAYDKVLLESDEVKGYMKKSPQERIVEV